MRQKKRSPVAEADETTNSTSEPTLVSNRTIRLTKRNKTKEETSTPPLTTKETPAKPFDLTLNFSDIPILEHITRAIPSSVMSSSSSTTKDKGKGKELETPDDQV